MRLDKFISESAPYSRSDIKKMARAGKISVNGETVKQPETQIDETKDIVEIAGERVSYRKFIYLMLNKPQGYLSATDDKYDPVVTDLIPEDMRHYNAFPVGRLDKDTEGLLILTNDGQLDHNMTSPKKDVYKRYFAILDKPAEAEDIERFAAGMTFREFTAKSAKLEIEVSDPRRVYIEIAEGKFHQVKRMCEQCGKTVTFLKRVAIGKLPLDPALGLGNVRELTQNELETLMKG